jgi:hypothetical protein
MPARSFFSRIPRQLPLFGVGRAVADIPLRPKVTAPTFDPDQGRLFHLGGPPGKDLNAKLARKALDQAVRIQDWSSGETLEPGEAPVLHRAADELATEHPDTFENLERIYRFTEQDDPTAVGHFRPGRTIYDLRKVDELTPEEIRDVMTEAKSLSNENYGQVGIRQDLDALGLDNAKNTLRHEFHHLNEQVDNPKWAQQLYRDTLEGRNPHFERQLERVGAVTPELRYQQHPEEIAADNYGATTDGSPDNDWELGLYRSYDEHRRDLEAQWKKRQAMREVLRMYPFRGGWF